MTGSDDLPAGLVSFVLTDIEGSTRLLRSDPARYDELLDLHHAGLRAVWQAYRGHELGTEGDSFLVAFGDAGDAVAAAARAQEVVAATPWPTDLPVRIRAGVHTGYAQPRGGEYRAMAVHQTARVAAAAHGGQVLVTDDTVQRLHGLPAGVRVQQLGRYRVRDFDEPVLLHRAVSDAAPGVTAAPRVRPADGHNIVAPRTSLVGREDDVAAVCEMLWPGAVVSVIGPGGVGKTRLCLEVGMRAVPTWKDGVWFVDLSPVTSAAAVPAAVAAAVGAPVLPGAEPRDLVRDFVRDRQLLLVLDNCEHLLGAVGTLVLDLTEQAPGVGVLATSRVPLGLRAERAYRLGPLLAHAGRHPGVELFRQRSAVSGAVDVEDVRRLVDELDGLPLAIELAAARTTSMSPGEILTRLQLTPSLIESRDPTLPERQRSLERLLDWSFQLLPADTGTVLLQLGVFAGGFDLDTAEKLCRGVGMAETVTDEAMWTLLDHSLVVRDVAAGATRFRLPVTVRSYVRQRLADDEARQAADRLAGVYLDRFGPGHGDHHRWVGAVALEVDNMRFVIQGLAGRNDEPAQRLAWSLARYHDVLNAFREAIDETAHWCRELTTPTPSRVALLTLLADLRLRIGELAPAQDALREARALAEEVGPPPWDEAAVTRTAGEVALRVGDLAGAASLARDGLAGTTSPRGRARLWNLLGLTQMMGGEQAQAVHSFTEELAAVDSARIETFVATTHSNLAEAYLQLGDLPASARHQRLALDLARTENEPVLVAFALMVAARLSQDLGWEAEDAVLLQAVADRLLDEAAFALYPEDAEIRAALLQRAEAALGGAAYRRVLREAATHDVDAAADLAGRVLAQAGRLPAATGAGPRTTSHSRGGGP